MQTEDFAPFPTAPLKTSRIQMTVNIFKNCLKMEAVFQKKKRKKKKNNNSVVSNTNRNTSLSNQEAAVLGTISLSFYPRKDILFSKIDAI